MMATNKVKVDEYNEQRPSPPGHNKVSSSHALNCEALKRFAANLAPSLSPSALRKAQIGTLIILFFFVRWFLSAISPTNPYSLEEYLVCDRSDYRTNVCRMKGDVRVDGKSRMILLCSHTAGNLSNVEKVKPYPRKWEESVMSTIEEITLGEIAAKNPSSRQQYSCNVRHKVPAVVFSTGGHTNNFYHAFQDGLIPMFIAASRFHGEVVFVIMEYHDWWMAKYGEIFRQLSHYDPVDFNNDPKVHCFPEAMVGLKVHDKLTIDSSIDKNVSMAGFQKMLEDAYAEKSSMEKEPAWNNNTGVEGEGEKKKDVNGDGEGEKKDVNGDGDGDGDGENNNKAPSLLIISREGSSRYMVNEEEMAEMARGMGFRVTILKKLGKLKLKAVYRQVHACDVLVGVHGAGMTHLLFMHPGSTLIQVIPLGLTWAALNYYGQPAQRVGVHYVEYRILPQESSLSKVYPQYHPLLVDPDKDRGWAPYKKTFLDGQNVTLDLPRFRSVLLEAYKWATEP